VHDDVPGSRLLSTGPAPGGAGGQGRCQPLPRSAGPRLSLAESPDPATAVEARGRTTDPTLRPR
jgi:hypothetical protein